MDRNIDEAQSTGYAFVEDAAMPTRQECVRPRKMNFSITPSRQHDTSAKKRDAPPRGIH